MIPGRHSAALSRRLKPVECREVTCLTGDFPVFWRKAAGSTVCDADGNRFLDMTAAFGAANLGHGHPAIAGAIRRQARRLIHGMGDVHPPEIKVRFLEKLAGILPKRRFGWKTILSQNGSDAVESAIKTAMMARPGKSGIVAFTGAYHGLSLGALSATSGKYFRGPFERRLSGRTLFAPYPYCYRCPLNLKYPACGLACLDEAKRKIRSAGGGRKFCAGIVEPMQGRGGEIIPPAGWLAGLAAFCRRERIVLIADEVYTGFGRTGKLFGCEHDGVTPDVMCLGKAMTGGFPMSACAGSAAVMDAWPPSKGEAVHTSTFLGNPLGCAAGLAALATYRQMNLAGRARRMGSYLLDRLRRHLVDLPGIGDIRGKGLMAGIELVSNRNTKKPDGARVGRMMAACLKRGLIVLGGGVHQNVISLSPPLTVSRREIDFCVDVLEDALRTSKGGNRVRI